jgi:hypothetical protein
VHATRKNNDAQKIFFSFSRFSPRSARDVLFGRRLWLCADMGRCDVSRRVAPHRPRRALLHAKQNYFFHFFFVIIFFFSLLFFPCSDRATDRIRNRSRKWRV